MAKVTQGISWDPKTLERAQQLADGGSVSRLVNELVDAQYDRLHPEPPIDAICPDCGQESTFTFVAYWASESDVYRCETCNRIVLKEDISHGNE